MIAAGSVLVSRYRIVRLIAQGGMAQVYEAHDEVLDRPVAVKVLRQGEPIDRRRFDREVKVLAGLTHPNLVEVYDAGEEDGDLFVVLELIEGPTLADRVRSGPLGAEDVRVVGRQLASALAYVHDAGIVHRDVKPSNVLFDGQGRARLGDFGIARVADATSLTSTSMTVGTFAYMAPEQLEGLGATAAVDIYALGVVLLECLSGQHPFPGAGHEPAFARLHRDPDVPDTLAPPWPTLLRGMTSREPSSRPSASEVVAVVDADRAVDAPTLEIETDPRTAIMPAASAPERRSPSRRALAAAVAVVAVLLLAFAAALQDDPNTTVVESTTTVTTPTTAPASVDSTDSTDSTAVDCAALESESQALADRRREINQEYRDDRETRDRLRDEVQALQREVDALLREHCR